MPDPLILSGNIDAGLVPKVCEYLWSNPTAAEIVMTSPGGDLIVGLALHDLFEEHGAVCVTVYGGCYSSAVLALQGAARRLASKSTLFLEHDTTVVDEPTDTEKIKNESRLMETVSNAHVAKLVANRIGEENFNKAYDLKIFDAETALNLNFIDEIVS